MKRFKNYAFLSLVLGLVLTLTPTQSFASRYLAVGHRTDPVADASTDSTAESANMTDSGQLGSGNIADDSGQLGSGNIFDEVTGFATLFFS